MTRELIELVTKDPVSVEPYGLDWTEYLAELGDEVIIIDAEWSIEGPDETLTVAGDDILEGRKTRAMLSGGTRYSRYTVINRITTNTAPQVVDERTFEVYVDRRAAL